MVIEIYCNGDILSSIVNDGIREFYIFLREDPTSIKSTKRTKSTKSTKSDFLHLKCFMRTKSTKSTRRQASGSFHLDVFIRTKMLSFFIFAYVRFVFLVRVGSSRKKVLNSLIPSFTILLLYTTDNILHLFIFIYYKLYLFLIHFFLLFFNIIIIVTIICMLIFN